MQIEKIKIEDVKPYKNNAKLHPPEQIEQIKKSIKEFGNNDPIAIDENGVIIEGHGRFLALKELGFKEIEVIRLKNLTEEQKRAYTIIHNKLTINTNFDDDILYIELNGIKDLDMLDFGFETIETNDIFSAKTDENYINELLNQEVGVKAITSDYFSVTFTIPIEYQQKVKDYIKGNGREKLLDLILKVTGAV